MATKQDVWRRMGTATKVFNAEIKREIERQFAIDTGLMRNVTRAVKIEWDGNSDDFKIKLDSTFYYKFVDEGFSRKWKGGKVRRNLTKAFLKRKKVVEQLEKLTTVFFEYMIDKQFE